jgi:putative phosphonate transport system ATP-binding protein
MTATVQRPADAIAPGAPPATPGAPAQTLPADTALRVAGLVKRYGRGCPVCLERTGPGPATNTCPDCGAVVACAGVAFDLRVGRTLGIVGESGSGKTTVLRCLYGDLTPTAGSAYLRTFGDGARSLYEASGQERRRIRNFQLGMVYQHPRDGLNLRISAGGNVAERLLAAEWRRVDQIRDRAITLLSRMEVPVRRVDTSPAALSGGCRSPKPSPTAPVSSSWTR